MLNPVRRNLDGARQIVEANVFDLPFKLTFKLKNGRYDPEMLDPESGFLNQAPKSEGPCDIWFGSDPILYASILNWNDNVYCYWEPWDSLGYVGFRGASTGNIPAELLESEEEAAAWQFSAIVEDLKKEIINLHCRELKEQSKI